MTPLDNYEEKRILLPEGHTSTSSYSIIILDLSTADNVAISEANQEEHYARTTEWETDRREGFFTPFSLFKLTLSAWGSPSPLLGGVEWQSLQSNREERYSPNAILKLLNDTINLLYTFVC